MHGTTEDSKFRAGLVHIQKKKKSREYFTSDANNPSNSAAQKYYY